MTPRRRQTLCLSGAWAEVAVCGRVCWAGAPLLTPLSSDRVPQSWLVEMAVEMMTCTERRGVKNENFRSVKQEGKAHGRRPPILAGLPLVAKFSVARRHRAFLCSMHRWIKERQREREREDSALRLHAASCMVEELESSGSGDDEDVARKRARTQEHTEFAPIHRSQMISVLGTTTVDCSGKALLLIPVPTTLTHPSAPHAPATSDVPSGSAILKIQTPWIDLILGGFKSLEIRGTTTEKPRGTEGDRLLASPSFACMLLRYLSARSVPSRNRLSLHQGPRNSPCSRGPYEPCTLASNACHALHRGRRTPVQEHIRLGVARRHQICDPHPFDSSWAGVGNRPVDAIA